MPFSLLRWTMGAASGVVLLVALLWPWLFGKRLALQITPEQLAEFAPLNERARAEWLTKFSNRLARAGNEAQVVVVQYVPGGPPLVVSNVVDDDGNEEVTHWPAPWPAVEEHLKTAISGQDSFRGTYAGMRLMHTLAPLDRESDLYLLINRAEIGGAWFGWRGLFVLLGLALGLGAVAMPAPTPKALPKRRLAGVSKAAARR